MMIDKQLILINKPDDPPTLISLSWRKTSSPDLAVATDDIEKATSREVGDQLGGSDHRPVMLHIKINCNKKAPELDPS